MSAPPAPPMPRPGTARRLGLHRRPRWRSFLVVGEKITADEFAELKRRWEEAHTGANATKIRLLGLAEFKIDIVPAPRHRWWRKPK